MFRLALWIAISVCAEAASISGIVRDARTGSPLRKVSVTLEMVGAKLTALETTDAQGRFTFSDVPAAEYRFKAWRQGYGRRDLPRSFRVARDEARTDVILELVPRAAVSGTIKGDLGEPMTNAEVQLLRRTWERGRPVYERSTGGRTDDRGAYRIFDVEPGTYIVAVKSYRTIPLDSRKSEVYAMEFWRGGATADGATPVVLAPGTDLANIDFQLEIARTTTIRGRAAGLPDDDGRRAFSVLLVSRDLPGFADHNSGFTNNPADWTYEFPNVLPGNYSLVLRYEHPPDTYYASAPVDARGGGTLDVNLTAQRSVPVSGRVRSDQPLNAVQVRLVPAERLHRSVNSSLATPLGADGQFRFPAVLPATWDIDVEGLPENAYVESMRVGEKDVLVEDMVVPGMQNQLEIVVSHRAARIQGKTTPGATVVIAPEVKRRSILGMYYLAAAGEDGSFEATRIRPGAYKLFAFANLDDPNAWQDPEFLPRYEAFGVVVTAKPESTVSAEVIAQ